MAQNLSVRFIHNFIIKVIQTVEENDKLVAKEKRHHILAGDIYSLAQYHRHPDGKLDLHFPDSSPLSGVAHRVEDGYCELTVPKKPTRTVTTGCAGCGGKKRKKK